MTASAPCSLCGVTTTATARFWGIRRAWDTTTGRELDGHIVHKGQPLCETCEPQYEGEGGG